MSWWAPSVVTDEKTGAFHLFVVCVDGGIRTNWGGGATIQHFTSADGLTRAYQDTPTLLWPRCIDPCLAKIGDAYWMWYKDECHGSHIWAAKSPDLKDWTVVGEMVGDRNQEAPLVWRWKDRDWMVTDQWRGLGIYSLSTGTDDWKFNTMILDHVGSRDKDDANGQHPFILTQGDRAFVFYFVRYGTPEPVYNRRSVIQIAELGVGPDGKLTCDRNAGPGSGGGN